MIGPYDVLVYCVAASVVIVALAAAYRLVRTSTLAAPPLPEIPVSVEADTTNVLAARLQEFQAARFASPIVQRVLPPDAHPRHKFSRGNVAPPTKPTKKDE